MDNKVKVDLKRRDNGKMLMSYTYDGPISDFKGILDSANERIKNNPSSFENMQVLVEATDGKETLASLIDNYKWWSPQQPRNKRFAKVVVNGTESKIKIPTEILQGDNYLDNALAYAKHHVQGVYQSNFPKGTPINIFVEVDLGQGKTMGASEQIIAGESNQSESEDEMTF